MRQNAEEFLGAASFAAESIWVASCLASIIYHFTTNIAQRATHNRNGFLIVVATCSLATSSRDEVSWKHSAKPCSWLVVLCDLITHVETETLRLSVLLDL